MKIALISGASSGIGREFAKQVDDMKFDEIWGVALEEDLLQSLKNELTTPVKTFSLDLCKAESFDVLKTELENQNAQVDLLINCSGFGKFGRYDEIAQDACDGMIDLNCKGYVRMTNMALKFMADGAKIINVASISAIAPIPYINVYAATKAFVLSWSRALNVELRHRNIKVTCVCPFWTKTKFFARAKQTNDEVISYYAAMYDPRDVVARALSDSAKGKDFSTYGFITKAQRILLKFIPLRLFYKIWLNQQRIDEKY